jgi:hypothetical protein
MQKPVMVAALAAVFAISVNDAHAYDGPWCAVISVGGGFVSENCSMPSFDVCRAEASRFGPTSFCRQRGYFPGYSTENGRYRVKKSRRSRRSRPVQ